MTTKTLKIALTTMLVTACGHEKECTPQPLAEQIVGSWNAELVSEHSATQEITFENSGRFKESKWLLFGAANSPICTWEVANDSVILSSKFSNGNTEQYKCAVSSRTCNQIVLELGGIDQLQLNKK